MAALDVYQLTIAAKCTGQWVNNVLHFQDVPGSSVDAYQTASDIITTYITSISTAWVSLFASDYQQLGYRCKRVKPLGGPSFTMPTPGVVGNVPDTQALTAAVGSALIFPYSTNGGVKWRTGRIFIPGVPEAYVVENQLTGAYLTALSNYASLLINPMTGADSTYQFGILAKKPTLQFWDAEEFTISGGLAYQRHRGAPVLGKPSRSSHKRRPV